MSGHGFWEFGETRLNTLLRNLHLNSGQGKFFLRRLKTLTRTGSGAQGNPDTNCGLNAGKIAPKSLRKGFVLMP
jgi:hypothetical protein